MDNSKELDLNGNNINNLNSATNMNLDNTTLLSTNETVSNNFFNKVAKKVWTTTYPSQKNVHESTYVNTTEFKTIELEVKDIFKQLNDKYISCWNFLHVLKNKINFSNVKDYFGYSTSKLTEVDESHLIAIKNELFSAVDAKNNLSKSELQSLMMDAYDKIVVENEKLTKIYNVFVNFEKKTTPDVIKKAAKKKKKTRINRILLITFLVILTLLLVVFFVLWFGFPDVIKNLFKK
ncbi:MAG: hypothetical protein HDR43_03065 [Mycoplasma sp.]|nr:hypothetical protein [Mycoplasma sp.]